MIYADDINIMDGSLHINGIKLETLLVASKEIVLKLNADKTKYIFMSLDQNVRRSHNMNNDNVSFDRVEVFEYVGTILTNNDSIQEDN